jgi:hypothetical protein
MGIGGSSAKTDRSVQLQSYGGLQNLFNWALPTAKSGVAAGQAGLASAGSTAGSAASYFQKLMSGNRAALGAATAPEANAIQSGTDASRRQLAASGTARGGGVAGTAQTAKDQSLAKVQNLLFGAQSEGAKGTLDAAKTQGSIGAAEAGIGENLAGIASSTESNMGALAGNSRQTSLQQQNAQGAAVGQILTGLLFA